MRVSSYKDDPGYRRWYEAMGAGKTVHVFLNGEEVQKCTLADDGEGFVQRCVLDAEGNAQIDPNDPERIWEERVEGDVRIVIA